MSSTKSLNRVKPEWFLLVFWVWSNPLFAAPDHEKKDEGFPFKSASESGETKNFSSLVDSCGASFGVTKEKGSLGEKVDPDKLEKNHVYMGYDSYFKGVFFRLTDENGVLDPRPLGEGTLVPCSWVGAAGFTEDKTALTSAVRSEWCKLAAKEGWTEVPATQIPPSVQIARLAPKTDAKGKLEGSTLTRVTVVPPAGDSASPVLGGVPVDTSTALSRRRPSPNTTNASFASVSSVSQPGQVSNNFSSSQPTVRNNSTQFPDIDPRNPPPGTHIFRDFRGRPWTIYGGYQVVIQVDGRVTQRPIGQTQRPSGQVLTPVSAPAREPATTTTTPIEIPASATSSEAFK